MTEALLDVRNLTVAFTGRGKPVTVVDDVSFQLMRSEALAIVGESGSGKTVTAMSILRLLPEPPSRLLNGSIWFGGDNLATMTEKTLCAVRGRRIGMVFQESMSSLNPVKSVGRQIMEPLRQHLGLSVGDARTRARRLLDRVRIPGAAQRFDSYPHELSGGQRQRVMIAIAIACDPEILIADEPTTALDVTIQAQVLELMREIQSESRMGVILITHDLGVVAEFAHRVCVMYAGRIVDTGPVHAFFERPAHPYSEALLRSLPDPERPVRRLAAIDGVVPRPAQMPPGCRFEPRCPVRRDVCTRILPELYPLGEDRRTACLAPFGFREPRP
jgi:oligopeptide/dipeptide ABC transporter ATP-binding protein